MKLITKDITHNQKEYTMINVKETFRCTYKNIDETFKCKIKLLDEVDMDLGLTALMYESENFKIKIDYLGSYNKDKQANTFKNHAIHCRVEPHNNLKYPTVSSTSSSQIYGNRELFNSEECPATRHLVDSSNYKEMFEILDEIYTFANKAIDEVAPILFPKDAKYI